VAVRRVFRLICTEIIIHPAPLERTKVAIALQKAPKMLIDLYTPTSSKPVKTVQKHGKLKSFHAGWINSHGTMCFAKFEHKSNAPIAYAVGDIVKVRMIRKKKRKPSVTPAEQRFISGSSKGSGEYLYVRHTDVPQPIRIPTVDVHEAMSLAAAKRNLVSEV
jgi:hypothetical protein